jgi:hypothetical protein
LDAVSVWEDATRTAPAAWWRHVFEVLDEALELAPNERAAYVDRACGGDHTMGAAAAAVLAAEASTFLDSPAAEFAAPFLRDVPLDLQPAWRVRVIGRLSMKSRKPFLKKTIGIVADIFTSSQFQQSAISEAMQCSSVAT